MLRRSRLHGAPPRRHEHTWPTPLKAGARRRWLLAPLRRRPSGGANGSGRDLAGKQKRCVPKARDAKDRDRRERGRRPCGCVGCSWCSAPRRVDYRHGGGGATAPMGRDGRGDADDGAGPAALLLAVTLTGAMAGPAAAQAAEDPAVARLLGELDRAWARRDVAGVVALFAPDGVILIDPANLYHAGATYQAGGGQPLGAGVPVLLGEPTDRIDVAGRQTAALDFRGAPATLVRWGYQQVGQVGLRARRRSGCRRCPR